MNIGIDIDGVLLDLERFELDYGTKFSLENGIKIEVDCQEYWDSARFNWTQEQEDKFWNEYLLKYFIEYNAREFAPEIIKKLKQEGNKIYIITARNEYGLPEEVYGKSQEITKIWLSKNNIEYDDIYFVKDEEKLTKCIDKNIDIMIEDSPSNIQNISEKIKVIKFDCRYNESITGKNIFTAYSWYHIYDIIKSL